MVDCHMHMVLSGGWWKDAIARHSAGVDITAVRSALAQWRSAGFTYLRDGGDRWGAGAAARELAGEYGITYRTPLSPLHKRGHYGSFIGTGFDGPAEFATLVAAHKAAGADFIKIMISGLMDFNRFGALTEESLPRREILELVAIVRDFGMPVMLHANGTQAVLAAAEAGADSVEHGAYLHEEALAAMAQSGTVWVPTLSTVANPRGTGRFSDAVLSAILDNTLENAARFSAMGGLVAPGSDAGAWAVPHGCSTEYDLLRQVLPQQAIDRGADAIRQKF